MASVALPFEGLPAGWQALFSVAFVVIVAMLAWTTLLFLRGLAWRRRAPAPDPALAGEWLWAVLVPALNEEAVIADSVSRLRAVDAARRLIVVIDDGSDDGTAAALAPLAGNDIVVLRREAPHARQGKAAALNAAYRRLGVLLAERGIPREQVIVAVVDADGRLAPDAPARVAPHFADPRVGGVQSLVRIYNRGRLLTWMQDVEFSIYGFLYQAGRSGWGSAGMGGNGQFNRLIALDDVADTVGPWHDRLTEDQDLGLRLIEAGWAGRQDLGATVDQQGLPGMRRLYRQRTRWAQGNLQAMGHLPVCWRSRLTPVARLDLLAYLLMPVWQTVVGVALVAAVALVATGTTGFWLGGPWWQMGFFYLLGFGGVIMGCVARGDGLRGASGALTGILVAQAYAFYSWILWPVLARAGTRQAIKRRGWEKTQREALGPASPPAQI